MSEKKDLKAFCRCVGGGNFVWKKKKKKAREEISFLRTPPDVCGLGFFFVVVSAWLVSWILKPALLTQNKGALMMFKGIWRAAVGTKLRSAFLCGREGEANGGQGPHGRLFAAQAVGTKPRETEL